MVRFATVDELESEREPPTAEELEQERQYWAGEALFGLMPSGYDPADSYTDSLDGVAAYYDPTTEAITVILDDDTEARQRYEVMVHEMTHAYQDAEYDLKAIYDAHATTFDRLMGSRATIEGEATLYSWFASFELDDTPEDSVNWLGTFGRWQTRMLDKAQQTTTPSLDALLLFPYAWGTELAHQAWDQGGAPTVSAIVVDPPSSTRDAMGTYDGGPFADTNLDAELDPHSVPVLPGHTWLGGGPQGAWLINAMFQRTVVDRPWYPDAGNVAADRLSVFRNDETGEAVAVWRMLFDEGTSPESIFEEPDSRWTNGEIETTRLYYSLEGTWVLIATESSDARLVKDSIEQWESHDAALERVGLRSVRTTSWHHGKPRRRRPWD